ncbi:MAG: hypothetical protein GX620_16175 [Chloroflexi bacterium]|nr:hypothetical protein [Chloroflexota bacterium]
MAINVGTTMDLTQAIQTIRWLDEERRKDKTIIATLQERIQEQQKAISQHAALIKELQTSLATVQGSLGQTRVFEQTVSNYKTEMVLLVEQREEIRRKEQAESERLRRIEYEALTSNLNRLEKQLRVLPRYDEQLTARMSETQRLNEGLQRLNEAVTDLSKRAEESIQPLPYLEEQRRIDARRISEVESEATELRRRIDALAKRLPLLDEAIRRQSPRIDEALQEVKKYERPIEELRISDFQREQKMRQYLDQAGLVAQELERVRTQTVGFLEQQQQVKRAMEKLDVFQGRIETRQNEIAQRQRLAEDQIKRQWEEWQDEQVRKYKKLEVAIEERWGQQRQINQDLDKRLNVFPPIMELHQRHLEALWEIRRNDATSILKASQDVYDVIISPIDQHLANLRGEQKE